MDLSGKYLITTDSWFYAPDGLKYRSVWGEVNLMEDSELGIKTNRNSSNWYAHIGSKNKGVIVAGCQIHYAVRCEKPPNTGRVKEQYYGESAAHEYERVSEIYLAE